MNEPFDARGVLSSGVESDLLALAAALDVEAARRRGTADLLEKVIDATFECPLMDTERRAKLYDAYRELARPEAPPLIPDQVAQIEALLSGGGR